MYAKVLIDLKVDTLNKLFDYIIPLNMIDDLKIGMRVVVPFGSQKRLGFVIDIIDESKVANREIIEVLDIKPTINKELFLYIDYLKKTNYTLLINILETILPKELFLKYDTTLTLNKDINVLSNNLKSYFKNKEKVKYTKELNTYKKEIEKLIDENILTLNKEYEQVGRAKKIKAIYYNENHPPYSRINNYKDLINFVKENEGLIRAEISKNNFSLSSINTLIKNEVFIIKEELEYRDITFKDTKKIEKHTLNKEQKDAFNKVKENINKNEIFLLKGITGSGKTEVYMHLINEVLNNKKKVLYLVPEISLIAPTVNYLKSRFDINITHYNSRLSKGERFDAWQKINKDEAKIIVGTRSSVFLPINDLGIIIVDEEHDNSYNQTERVKYSLIDMLKIKSKYYNIPVILGSATPKITSMYKALNNEYKLLKLTKRATNKPLPKIYFADMKEEMVNGNLSIFSKILKEKINERLKKNEQIILMYNRKGYANFSLCRECGFVKKCKSCDISLTYYKEDNTLRCSYCNYKEERKNVCESCGSSKVGLVGLGVEQVYDLVKKEFKNSKVLLMDQKSTRFKGAHEQIWLDFKEHKYDILVGTQMISKGLDFKNVTLVGILMADLELKSPNYLASEHTYNLLTQMVGRSGRKIEGEAVIQGYDLNHPSIKLIDKPFNEFYKEAIYQREISKYEPFYKMVQILISNESYLKSYQDALNIKKELKSKDTICLGPSEPIIKYIKGEYRFVITIKAKKIDYSKIFKTINKYNNSKIEFLNIPEVL